MGCIQEGAQQLPSVSQHATVNHSIEFCEPIHWGAYSTYCNRVKTKFKRMKGVQSMMLSSYLDEFMWTFDNCTCLSKTVLSQAAE